MQNKTKKYLTPIMIVLMLTSMLTLYTVNTVNADTTLNYAIINGLDDGQEIYLNHGVNNDGSALNILNGGDWASIDVLFRFQNITASQGSTITNAILSLYIKSTTNDLTCTIYGDDVDNSSNLVGQEDIDGRTRTTANIVVSQTDLSIGYYQVNVSSIIQEIVNRAGWVNGNSLSFMLITQKGSSESCELSAYESGVPEQYAKLDITYNEQAPPEPTPTPTPTPTPEPTETANATATPTTTLTPGTATQIIEEIMFGNVWFVGLIIFLLLALALLRLWKYAGCIIIPILIIVESQYYLHNDSNGSMIWPMVILGITVLTIAAYTVDGLAHREKD